jgi:hypothetical protein
MLARFRRLVKMVKYVVVAIRFHAFAELLSQRDRAQAGSGSLLVQKPRGLSLLEVVNGDQRHRTRHLEPHVHHHTCTYIHTCIHTCIHISRSGESAPSHPWWTSVRHIPHVHTCNVHTSVGGMLCMRMRMCMCLGRRRGRVKQTKRFHTGSERLGAATRNEDRDKQKKKLATKMDIHIGFPAMSVMDTFAYPQQPQKLHTYIQLQ